MSSDLKVPPKRKKGSKIDANGRFLLGHVGGPGVPKGNDFQKNSAELRRRLVSEGHVDLAIEVYRRALESDDLAIALKAAGDVTNRVAGKPGTAVEVTHSAAGGAVVLIPSNGRGSEPPERPITIETAHGG